MTNIHGFLMFVRHLKIKEIAMFKKKFGNAIYTGVFIMNNLENEWGQLTRHLNDEWPVLGDARELS